MKKFIFSFISIIFHPVFMPLFGILIIININGHLSLMTNNLKKLVIFNTLFYTVLIPLFFYFIIFTLELLNIIKFEEKTKRKILLLLSFFSFYFGYFSISKIGIPKIYPLFILSVAFSNLLIYFINVFYKISLHACGISGILALLLFIAIKFKIDTLFFIIIGFFITSLILIARVGLKKHTIGEYIVGLFTGFLSIYIIMNIFI